MRTWEVWLDSCFSMRLPAIAGAYEEPHHVAIRIFQLLPDIAPGSGKESGPRRLFQEALGNLINLLTVLPEDEIIRIRLYYLLQTAAVAKPAKARRFIRTLLFDELFVGKAGAGADLQCLLLAVTAKYELDDGLIAFIHASVGRHCYFEYLLTAFRVLFRECERGDEALLLLDRLLETADDARKVDQLQTQFRFFLKRHDLGALERWVVENEANGRIRDLNDSLHVVGPWLSEHLSQIDSHILIRVPRLISAALKQAGADDLLGIVTLHKREKSRIVQLLTDLAANGLKWEFYDPLAYDKFAIEGQPKLGLNGSERWLDRAEYEIEIDILLTAQDKISLPSWAFEKMYHR